MQGFNVFIQESDQPNWRLRPLHLLTPDLETIVLDNSSGGAVGVSGLEVFGQQEGETVRIFNRGADPINLLAENLEVGAAYRFASPVTIAGGAQAQLYYVNNRWEALIIGSGVGGIGDVLSGGQQGSVLFAGAGGALSQNNSKLFWDDTKNKLYLLDKANFSTIGGATTTGVFQIGTRDPYIPTTAAFFVANETNFEHLDLTGQSGKYAVNTLNRFNLFGSPADPTVMVNWATIFSNGFTPTGFSSIYGYSANLDIGFPASEVYGGSFSVVMGSSAAGGVQKMVGVRGIVGYGHNGSTGQSIGVDSYLSSGVSDPGTADSITMFRGGLNSSPGSQIVVTTLKGLDFSGWINGGSGITNSYGIYADATIDVGTALKYFIYSLSTSPSLFSGPVSGPINAYNRTTWNGSAKFATEDAVSDKLNEIFADRWKQLGIPDLNVESVTRISGALANGQNDVYTVPAGKKVIVADWFLVNTTGATISRTPYVKISGTYYRLFNPGNVSANNFVDPSFLYVYEAGETIAITASAVGLNYYLLLLTLPDTVPIKSVKLTGTQLSTTTAQALYTAPNGVTAIPLSSGGSSGMPSGLGTLFLPGSLGIAANDTGGSITIITNLVPNGGSPLVSNQIQSFSVGSASAGTVNSPKFIQDQETLYVTSNSANVNQFVWGTLYEFS